MEWLKLNPYPTIAASSPFSLATGELEGKTVLAIAQEMGGTFTKAQLTNYQIRAGGKPILPKVAGDNLQAYNDYQGITADASQIVYWFMDPTANTIKGQRLGGLDMSLYGGEPLVITGDIGAATSPTLQAWALVAAPKELMGLDFTEAEAAIVRALIPTVQQPAAAVTRQAIEIGIGSEAGARVRQLAFFHTNLTSVEWRKNQQILHEDLSIAEVTAWANAFARSAQSGLYVVDRVMDGAIGNAETTVQPNGRPWPQQVLITTSASDTLTIYADVLAALQLI